MGHGDAGDSPLQSDPVEGVADRRPTRGGDEIVETERLGDGEVGGGDFRQGMAVGLGDPHDVGSGDQSLQRGQPAGGLRRHAATDEFTAARFHRGGNLRIEHPRQHVEHGADALAVARDDGRDAPGEIEVADEPDDAVREQVLDLGVETELVLTGYLAVEPVDGEVQLHQPVGIAGHRVGLGDGGGIRPGLVDEAGHQGRAAPVDDDVGERGRDDLPAQAVAPHGVGEPTLQRGGEVALQFAVEIGVVGDGARE